MNWYKLSKAITPDQDLVNWMAKQVKPYLQSLSINKRIKTIKEKIEWVSSEVNFNRKVLKDPNALSNLNYIEPRPSKSSMQKRFNLIQERNPSLEKELIELNQKLEALLSMPKAKFPSVKDNPTGKIEMNVPMGIIPENIQELMKTNHKSTMKLIMYYRIKGAGGTYREDYTRSSMAVEVDLLRCVAREDPYLDLLETLNHELVHNIQHLMSTKEYSYGMPSKNISTPEYEYKQYWNMPHNKGKSYPYHSMLDEEFYPRLSDRITRINYLKKQHPNLDNTWFRNFIEKDEWLNVLKKNSIGKYQKAITEMVRAWQEKQENTNPSKLNPE